MGGNRAANIVGNHDLSTMNTLLLTARRSTDMAFKTETICRDEEAGLTMRGMLA